MSIDVWHASGISSSFTTAHGLIGLGECMNNAQMLKKISELESINDQLQAEIRYLDRLLKEIGFQEGLKTLKFAAKEMIEQDKLEEFEG